MINVGAFRFAAIIAILMILLGCARSEPVNYYILRSIQNPGPESPTALPEREPAVGVGPVKVPDYLDRPQIASRLSDNGLQFAEFDRWAEPLDKNLPRILADNLAVLLPSQRVFVFPWPKSVQVRYQVTLEIIHLEKASDGKVILEASWNILDSNGEKLLLMRRTKLVQPVESAGYDAVASGESRAVEELSREIAEAIRSLPL